MLNAGPMQKSKAFNAKSTAAAYFCFIRFLSSGSAIQRRTKNVHGLAADSAVQCSVAHENSVSRVPIFCILSSFSAPYTIFLFMLTLSLCTYLPTYYFYLVHGFGLFVSRLARVLAVAALPIYDDIALIRTVAVNH